MYHTQHKDTYGGVQLLWVIDQVWLRIATRTQKPNKFTLRLWHKHITKVYLTHYVTEKLTSMKMHFSDNDYIASTSYKCRSEMSLTSHAWLVKWQPHSCFTFYWQWSICFSNFQPLSAELSHCIQYMQITSELWNLITASRLSSQHHTKLLLQRGI